MGYLPIDLAAELPRHRSNIRDREMESAKTTSLVTVIAVTVLSATISVSI